MKSNRCQEGAHNLTCVHANKTPSDHSQQHISQLPHYIFNSRRDGRFGRAGGTKALVGYQVQIPLASTSKTLMIPTRPRPGEERGFLTSRGKPLEGSFWTFFGPYSSAGGPDSFLKEVLFFFEVASRLDLQNEASLVGIHSGVISGHGVPNLLQPQKQVTGPDQRLFGVFENNHDIWQPAFYEHPE